MAKPKKERGFSFETPAELLTECFDNYRYFHPETKGAEPAIPYHWVQGETRLVVVTGENASGKSFMRRLVSVICRDAQPKVESLRLSLEGRGDDFGGLKFLVYGNEREQSTGVNSCVGVLTGIKTCRGRENPHIIFYDEPDLGLSDNWAAGMGQTIREFAEHPGKHTKVIFLVTHSKALVRQLASLNPTYVYLGGDPGSASTLQGWLDQPVVPKDISLLREIGHKRWQAIQKILNDIRKNKP